MLKLFSRNSNLTLLLSKQQALSLELYLNTSEFGEKWCKLGDILYNFSISLDDCYDVEIETEQLLFLVLSLKKTDKKY